MWDVGRFAQQIAYSAIIFENVVEASKWTGWHHWLGWLADLGYSHRVVSANSMFSGVPQSRDRIFVVFWPGICMGCGGKDVIADLAGWWPGWGTGFWVFSSGMTHNNEDTWSNTVLRTGEGEVLHVRPQVERGPERSGGSQRALDTRKEAPVPLAGRAVAHVSHRGSFGF